MFLKNYLQSSSIEDKEGGSECESGGSEEGGEHRGPVERGHSLPHHYTAPHPGLRGDQSAISNIQFSPHFLP